MTPYFVTVFLVFLFASAADRERIPSYSEKFDLTYTGVGNYRFIVIIVGLILIFVSAFRYDVGTDYLGYLRTYPYRAQSVWTDFLSFNEPGLGFIAWFSLLFSNNPAFFFLLVAIVTVTLNLIPISKYSDSFLVGVLLYVFLGTWHNSFNGVRQYLAAAVLFYGHRCMIERNIKKYILVVLVASLFHTTALVMLPVYFFVGRRFTLKNALLILAGTIVIRYSYELLFDIMSFLKGHEQSQYEYMQTSVKVLRVLVTIPPIILAALTPREYKEEPENAFYMGMLIVNAGFMIGASGSAYLARVAIYTEAFATIAIPRFLRAYNENSRKFLTMAVIILYAIFWWYELSVRDSLNNFQWIFGRF